VTVNLFGVHSMPRPQCFHMVVDLSLELSARALQTPSTLAWWQQTLQTQRMLEQARQAGRQPLAVQTGLSAFIAKHLVPGTFSVCSNVAAFDPVLILLAELHRRHGPVLL